MITAVNSTCRAEAEPAAAEDDAEAEAEAGRVHGGNNCSQFSDRCSEALGTVPAKCVPGSSIMMGATIALFFFVQVIVNAEAEVEPECMRTPLQHIAQKKCNSRQKYMNNLKFCMRFGDFRDSGTVLGGS